MLRIGRAAARLVFDDDAYFPQFDDRMTPIRANIVGPPPSATRISACIAACIPARRPLS
jgi:hypothetical protein